MRLLAYVLIASSLVAGALAALTAYTPPLGAAAASDTPLTLNAPAGRDPDAPERPLLTPDAEAPVRLTRDLVAQLVEQRVDRVRVKEFAFGRWDLGWLFGLSALGLLAGGLIIRREDLRHVASLLAAEPSDAETPHYALAAARREVEALLRDVRAAAVGTDPEIARRLDAVQSTHLLAFVEARPELIGRFGIAGYARLMDAFASAERSLHRAWSAAADHAQHEAVASLERGLEHLAETEAPGRRGWRRPSPERPDLNDLAGGTAVLRPCRRAGATRRPPAGAGSALGFPTLRSWPAAPTSR